MKIGLQLAQLHKNQTLFQGDKVSPEQGLHMFLRKTACAGLLTAEGVMANAQNVPVNEQDRNQLATQLVYHGMAGAMARNHDLLPGNSREMAAKAFGQQTNLELPSGDPLDTTSLNRQRMTMHSSNNRLGVTSTAGALNGMRDSLNPDFSSVTKRFVDASLQTTVACAALRLFIHY